MTRKSMTVTARQSTEQAITQAAKLYQIRATVRQQLGERFPAVMRQHIDWLRRISGLSGQSIFSVAIQAAKELEQKYQHTAAGIVLAAAVEEAEPTKEGDGVHRGWCTYEPSDWRECRKKPLARALKRYSRLLDGVERNGMPEMRG